MKLMKSKLFAIAGALISLIISACDKPHQAETPNTQQDADAAVTDVQQAETPSTQQGDDANAAVTDAENIETPNAQQGDDANIEDPNRIIEEYANNFVEYFEYETIISDTKCSLYGVGSCIDVKNRLKMRCVPKKPKDCECLNNNVIVDCSAEYIQKAFRKGKAELRKYFVKMRNSDQIHYSDYNGDYIFKGVIKEVCPVDGDKVSDECECNLISDLTSGNHLGDKKPPSRYSHLPGRTVDCKNDEVR